MYNTFFLFEHTAVQTTFDFNSSFIHMIFVLFVITIRLRYSRFVSVRSKLLLGVRYLFWVAVACLRAVFQTR